MLSGYSAICVGIINPSHVAGVTGETLTAFTALNKSKRSARPAAIIIRTAARFMRIFFIGVAPLFLLFIRLDRNIIDANIVATLKHI